MARASINLASSKWKGVVSQQTVNGVWSVLTVSCLLLLSWSTPSTSAAHWDYTGEHGVDKWADHFPSFCNGNKQSPIDISESYVDPSLGPVVFTNYNDPLHKAFIYNNGHTVQMTAKGSPATISGGCVKDQRYHFEQLHFHWGSTDKMGSEHVFEGKAYPLEIHFVHRNVKYATLMEALYQPDGLAVLAVFFKISSSDNKNLDPIVDTLHVIKYANKNDTVKHFSLDNLLSKNLGRFFCYEGSLTTPTCNEVVTWTVFPEPLHISRDQIKEFRKVHFGTDSESRYMVNNFRPAQPLNGRQVKFYDSAATGLGTISSLVLTMSLLATLCSY